MSSKSKTGSGTIRALMLVASAVTLAAVAIVLADGFPTLTNHDARGFTLHLYASNIERDATLVDWEVVSSVRGRLGGSVTPGGDQSDTPFWRVFELRRGETVSIKLLAGVEWRGRPNVVTCSAETETEEVSRDSHAKRYDTEPPDVNCNGSVRNA